MYFEQKRKNQEKLIWCVLFEELELFMLQAGIPQKYSISITVSFFHR